MRDRRRSGFVALLLPLIGLAGCSMHKPPHQRLAAQAAGFNLTLEEAQNEMLLLNVIRAKDRLPMYLTAISSLNGNVSTRLTGGIGGSYTEANADTGAAQMATGGSLPAAMSTVTDSVTKTITRGLAPSLGGELSRNPNFTLAVLDGEKFMRGFLKPIDGPTFAYFWDQGWPPELLLYLLVQRVEEGGRVFKNYPPSSKDFKEFGDWVAGFIAADPRIVRRQVEHDLGPVLPTSAAADLGDLVAAAKEGLTVSRRGRDWQLRRRTSELFFTTSDQGETGADDGDQEGRILSLYGGPDPDSQVSDQRGARLVLRSPEAVLYYLGELMRVVEQKRTTIPHICIQEQYEPLFNAVALGSCTRSLVEARSPWGDFEIPPASPRSSERSCRSDEVGRLYYPDASDVCDSGRSMQTLRLLSQLISLQKSAEELPSPALVRVLGG